MNDSAGPTPTSFTSKGNADADSANTERPPYGTEQTYNGLRLAIALAKSDPAIIVTVFLMADAVVAAKSGQKTPDGYCNVERMMKGVLAGKGQVLLCGTCTDARGLADAAILRGIRSSTMAELAAADGNRGHLDCDGRSRRREVEDPDALRYSEAAAAPEIEKASRGTSSMGPG